MVKILIYLKVWSLKLILGLYSKQEDNYYDAYEKDIAVVHFFFQVCLYNSDHNHTFILSFENT